MYPYFLAANARRSLTVRVFTTPLHRVFLRSKLCALTFVPARNMEHCAFFPIVSCLTDWPSFLQRLRLCLGIFFYLIFLLVYFATIALTRDVSFCSRPRVTCISMVFKNLLCQVSCKMNENCCTIACGSHVLIIRHLSVVYLCNVLLSCSLAQ
jgi:hypothetical protein